MQSSQMTAQGHQNIKERPTRVKPGPCPTQLVRILPIPNYFTLYGTVLPAGIAYLVFFFFFFYKMTPIQCYLRGGELKY